MQQPLHQLRPFLLLLAGLFFSLQLSAQSAEICDNGRDDDGDGLIDCFDPDCTCTGACDSFYYTTCNADCYYVAPCDQIQLGVQWQGQAETGTYSTLVAGDMDADGIPDIGTYRVEASDIYIIDGATGATKVQITGPTIYPGGTSPAIADLDHDGFGELVLIGADRILRCWNHDGSLLYESTVPVGYDQRYRFSSPNIADFDHNGWAEVNVGNQVFNGQTGALLASGGASLSAGEHPARRNNGFSFNAPVAMDVLPDNFCPDCQGLEIVAGNQVLSVNLNTGAVNVVVQAPIGYSDGFTSVADIDRDGDLDAVVQGRRFGWNTVYCWDIQTSTVLRSFALLNNYGEGASRVNVADLNGDGNLEVSFVSYPRLYALRNNFSIMWLRNTNDYSAVTSSSVFDFCGDGSADVIYRGETHLQVIEGATGNIKWEDDCISATHIECPLVLDVDADGQTEIVIECGSDPNSNALGTVVAYEAIGLPGIASRKVWNQHAYFNTNINEDLSVPQYQQNPNIVGDTLRMNTFMNQFFNPTFPTPDGALSLNNISCTGDSLQLNFTLCNPGDQLLPALMPVSVYRGNPQAAGAQWIAARPLGFDLQRDSCRSFSFRIPRLANDSLFVVLNDDNSIATPYSLTQDFPVTAFGECDFVNNMVGFYYDYNPAIVALGQDTAICDNGTLPLSAAGNQLVSWLWQNGSTQATFTAPGAGQYSVTATDVCGNTQTDNIAITIDTATIVRLGADRVICQGETVNLGESGFDFYGWTPGNAVDCQSCPSVKAGPGISGYVVLQAGFNNGCLSRDSVFIAVNDTFNIFVDTTICYGRQVEWNGLFINTDESATVLLSSQFGCDSTVTMQVKGSSVGTFNVTLDTSVCVNRVLPYNGFELQPNDNKVFLLTASTGCDSTVLVRVSPRDTFATAETQTLCAGQTAFIFGNPVTVSGLYSRTFTARNGCDSVHTVALDILDPILIEIDATPSCFNENTGVLQADATGNFPPFTYNWSPAPADSGPEQKDLPPGVYSLTVSDGNDCTQTANVTLGTYPAIDFTLTIDSVRCYDQSNGAINIATNDSTLAFSLNGQTFQLARKYENLRSGQYILYAEDVYGCEDSRELFVPQPPELLLTLPQDTVINLGDSIPFIVQHTALGALRYLWSDTTWLACVDCAENGIKPLATQRFRLRIVDNNGCYADDDWYIEVQRNIQVYVPNIFKPGAGDSDQNSRWSPGFGVSVEKVNLLQVYDRWGTLMHEVRNTAPGDTALEWDGRHKGKYAAPGVYVWRMEVTLVDGAVEKYSGTVTVIR
jgi:hypothetical protein